MRLIVYNHFYKHGFDYIRNGCGRTMGSKKRLKDLAASFLFTQRCRFCGRVIDIRLDCCAECESGKCEITGKICSGCGCRADECSCSGQIHFYRSVAAPYYYDGAAGKAVRSLKFNHDLFAGKRLADDMARCFFERFGEYSFDAVTFVPGTKNEFKKKRFNQAQFLAEKVSEHIHIECAPLLEKQFDTKPQHTLRDNERSGNLLGVFAVADRAPEIENARILLIDDVKTTGATLDECAKTLLVGGAAEVFCLTAAVARKKQGEKEDKDEVF